MKNFVKNNLLLLTIMASLFSRIIANEIPSYKVYEDDKVYAFLDIHPHTRGHTLLVPKTELDYFADLSEEYMTALMIVSQKIAKALDKAT